MVFIYDQPEPVSQEKSTPRNKYWGVLISGSTLIPSTYFLGQKYSREYVFPRKKVPPTGKKYSP